MLSRRSTVALCAVSLLAALALGDDGLPRAKLAQIGKAATALVECDLLRGKGHGSAFCIHPSGLFVTNEHVVRDSTAVRLVLDPSLKTQRIVKARVLRLDRERDLALLRAEDVKDLPALALGSDAGLSELQEIVAFGFPFGRSLTVVRDEYPSVSVNVGNITALRRSKGELHRIQVDAALNPGNSGGPVIDKQARVVGVVVAGVRGSGVNFVIPVSHLLSFVARPEITFAPPKVAPGDRHSPATFEARAEALVPGAALDLELVLAHGGAVRRVPMKREGERYLARAVPIPPTAGPTTLRLDLRFREGSVTGTVPDRRIEVGGKALELSKVRTARFGGKVVLDLVEGKSLEGPVKGLDELEVSLGGEKLRVPLASAVSASFEPVRPASTVELAVVARRGGKVVGEVKGALDFPDTRPVVVGPIAGTGPGVMPAALEADKVVRNLPAPVAEAAMAGGGRYLVLHMPKLRRLSLFDLTTTRLAGHIPLASDTILFAGGQTKVVVVLVNEGIIQRWDLATLKREMAVPLPFKTQATQLALGSGSEGPILVVGRDGPRARDGAFLDMQSLRPQPVRGDLGFPDHAEPLRVSTDGQTFGWFRPGTSPQGARTLWLEGLTARGSGSGENLGHINPSEDGRWVYTGRGVLTTSDLKPMGKVGRDGMYCLPAVRGPYYLGMTLHAEGVDLPRVEVFLAGDTRALLKLPKVAKVDWPTDMNAWDREKFGWDKRIWFVPEAQVLVGLPTLERLVLHRVDTESALAKADFDYLVVVSRPVGRAARGRAYEYPLQVKSKRGGVRYELTAGPAGMEVTKAGVVRWRVPADWKEEKLDVVVSVGDDSGQEVFHRWPLVVD